MSDLVHEIWLTLRGIQWLDVVDIALVTFLNYRLLMLIRGSRAWRIVLGAIAFVILLFVSNRAGLTTLHWILDKAALLAPVALVILLLPELRQALEGISKVTIGGIPIFPQTFAPGGTETEARTVEELVAAVAELAATRVGALIVIERGAPLDEVVANGVELNARVSAPLLGSIFYEGNPLHDGAVVIRGDQLVAAACRLPLSESPWLEPTLHMRHRAAVGATESFDCLAIVVSEERGTISWAHQGRLQRLASHQELREVLNRELRGEVTEKSKSRTRRARVRSGAEAANP